MISISMSVKQLVFFGKHVMNTCFSGVKNIVIYDNYIYTVYTYRIVEPTWGLVMYWYRPY